MLAKSRPKNSKGSSLSGSSSSTPTLTCAPPTKSSHFHPNYIYTSFPAILSFPSIASRKSTGSRWYSRQPAIRTSERYTEFLSRQEPKSRHRHADFIASPFSTNGSRTYGRVILTLYAPYRKRRGTYVFRAYYRLLTSDAYSTYTLMARSLAPLLEDVL